jgi:hypothetical protein
MNSIKTYRPAATPAYYMGRPAIVWQAALRREHARRAARPAPTD